MYSAAASFLSYEIAPRLFILGRERYGESTDTVLLCLRLANVSPFEGRGEVERQVEGVCLLLPSTSRTPLRMSLVSKAAAQVAPGVCNALAVVVTPVISTRTLIMTCTVCTLEQLYRPLTQLLLLPCLLSNGMYNSCAVAPIPFYTNRSNLTFCHKIRRVLIGRNFSSQLAMRVVAEWSTAHGSSFSFVCTPTTGPLCVHCYF